MSKAAQQSKDVAELPAAQLPAGAGEERGVAQLFSFTNFNDALKAAETICKTAMVPKQFQGNPAEILAVWQYGLELGLPPMQSLTAVALINGRPSLYGDGFLAVIRACSEFVDCLESYDEETKTATCLMRRRGKLDVIRTFSMEDAKIAGLSNKEGPWRNYPKRMCQMRARGFAGRDQFTDVLRGMLIHEEAQDIPIEREVRGEVVRPAGETRSQQLLDSLNPKPAAVSPTSSPGAAGAGNADQPSKDDATPTQQDSAKASESSGNASAGPTVKELLEQLAKAKSFDDVNIVNDVARSLESDAEKQQVLAASRARIKEIKGAV